VLEKFSLIFVLVFLFSLLFFLAKQPILISYILTGFFSTKIFSLDKETLNLLSLFSEIGIIFLLFLVGLNLKIDSFKDFFRISLILGLLQEIITTLISFFILKLLGFENQIALILSLAFSFSSTAIVMKIFTEKKILSTLYGKITVGFMIVQDIIAVASFIFLPFILKINQYNFSFLDKSFLNIIFGSLFLFLISFLILRFLNRIENFLEKSLELLFIFAIAFVFAVILILSKFNFPIELSAFLAGLLLSRANFANEVVSRLSSLRDFFLVLFFVYIGSFFKIAYFKEIIFESILISLFILIFNPLIVILILKLFSLPKRVSFIISLSAGQISEFSFILLNLLVKKNFFTNEFLKDKILSLVSLVGFITIFISSYLISFQEKIYQKIKKILFFLKEKEIKEEEGFDIILFGCDRLGGVIKDKLKNLNFKFLVIDYNPNIIDLLKKENVKSLYGDAKDIDFLDSLNFENSKVIISTIPDFETNFLILKFVKNKNNKLKFISVAYNLREMKELEKFGADFTFFPHLLGGKYIADILEKNKDNLDDLKFNNLNNSLI